MIVKPSFRLLYQGTNITSEISKDLISLTYTDHVEGESDDLEIIVDNRSGKWGQAPWYPEAGARLTLDIGYEDNTVPCGLFEVDTVQSVISVDGGDTIVIKGLSAFINQSLRTKRSQAYEDITLVKLANTIASRANMTVSNAKDIENIILKRVTQFRETDLTFLKKQSEKYGYAFNIKGNKIVFYKRSKLQDAGAVTTLKITDLKNFNVDNTTDRTFKVARQTYFNAETGKIEQYEQKAPEKFGYLLKNDTLELSGRVENKQQAEIVTKAALRKSINRALFGYADLANGLPIMLAGSNVEIQGVGSNSGIFQIQSSKHVLTGTDGYDATIEIFRVDLIDISKH